LIALARKTLLYEWRRYLPATLAVAFSGMLLLVQLALVLGIFGGAAVYINASRGQLWVGYPGTQSIDLGRRISPDAEIGPLMDPGVKRVEPFYWLNGDWFGKPALGGASVFISGIDPAPGGLAFARVIPPQLRARLNQPDAIIADATDVAKLGIRAGGTGILNGRRVRLVGVAHGIRALGGVDIVTSMATARDLTPGGDERPSYYIVQVSRPDQAERIRAHLRSTSHPPRYAVWTAAQFAQRTVRYWFLQTGAGLGVLFMSLVVFLVGTVITSQTLMGAVAGSIAEYATLNALGASQMSLVRVVLEQALWVGALGAVIGGVLSALLLWIARGHNVPVSIGPTEVLVCMGLVVGITVFSGLIAVRSLRKADPARLLR
jgi:putative ABC transport system permease protein